LCGGSKIDHRFRWTAPQDYTKLRRGGAVNAHFWEVAMIAAKRVEAEPSDQSRPRRMLDEKQVLEIIPVSRTTLFRMEKTGRFPKSTYISPNRRCWYEDQIIVWQDTVNAFDANRKRGKGGRYRK
jgi:predicted DNA-binding transcriptional regulator AlpA